MNDKLREALGLAKTKLQLYRQQHSGAYVGGMEYTALMKLIDEALAASKQEPQLLQKSFDELAAERRASKPEPQAQAGEPEPLYEVDTHGRLQATKPHSVSPGDKFITLQSHREAIAKKDAALNACVEALENIKSDYAAHDGKRWDIDAAITQAEEAMK